MTPETWAQTLEALPLAVALRHSKWVYPLINAGHILGIALLVGGIIPLDLRLIGGWSTVSLQPLWQVLIRTAATGVGLAMVCGALLFITRATAYLSAPLFILKMALVGVGLMNALILHANHRSQSPPSPVPWLVRCQAALSLGVWVTVLVLGRLVGYF